MFCACFFFLSTHFFRRPSTDILETFPHDVASAANEALLCRFPESAPNKNEGRKTLPNFTSNRNILSIVTRDVEGKSKTIVLITKFDGGRFNGDGDRRGRSYEGWENVAIFDIISRYISVKVQDSPIIAANDYNVA